jgi:hypothetical protein
LAVRGGGGAADVAGVPREAGKKRPESLSQSFFAARVHVKGRWRYRDGTESLVDVKNRRSLTPSTQMPAADDVHATRRGGARHEVSSRVTLRTSSGAVLEGWALNVSRGGVRVILEEKVELGGEFEVTIGTGGDEAPSPAQPGRVVWVQEEPDGVVAGIEFRSEPTRRARRAPSGLPRS